MITRGQLREINYNSNTGKVWLPIFQTAGTKEEIIMNCVFAIPPGVYNGYKVQDIVLVSFEVEDYNIPAVIGKLYSGTAGESEAGYRGTGKYDSLEVANSAKIPLETELIKQGSSEAVTNGISCKTIGDIVKKLNKFNELDELISGIKNKKITIEEIEDLFCYSEEEKCIATWKMNLEDNSNSLNNSQLLESTRLFCRSITYSYNNTAVDEMVELDFPDLPDKDKKEYDIVFIDIDHSFYYIVTEDSSTTPKTNIIERKNITNGSIKITEFNNIITKKILVPATAQFPNQTIDQQKACVTILYTKKDKPTNS